jgi:hypothetical protein
MDRRTDEQTDRGTDCCGVLLLTVLPVRGSFLPGDLALVSPRSVHLVTHLLPLRGVSHYQCSVASTPVHKTFCARHFQDFFTTRMARGW